ncbi:tagaturonate epimerase family protein [Salegentibacter sp. F188]|uniref:Tagaturonate/fructuronate epimerase n=1 Tax=Autumnicola patrickiae TaxID=3075591 RepID=A0ABU3DZ06_9FLAO|nr:tagaturonate epimerase family protein [Salegentibacter sp. F188]MDT0688958.1 tagaturonate epimerase family protein [Salegentibacter sp. F188]
MGKLGKYSFGTGDRFGKEGKAQLKAVLKMMDLGVEVTPVWNKSNREHETVGTTAANTRKEADLAVKSLSYTGAYLVDADHINLKTVDPYIPVSDFFTIDVADFIGKEAPEDEKKAFLQFFSKYTNGIEIEGIASKIDISEARLEDMLNNFLFAMKKAGGVYQHIKTKKPEDFYTEVSIDEVAEPQSPVELLFILAALAFYEVPLNTIAPKFTGEFNKGIDYRGDLKQFEKEFEEDLLVLKFAIKEFGLPENLKLSVHSGSDKFSIYPVMQKLISKHNTGLHLKTAGTTWLEELIGLAESEGEAFNFAKQIYAEALERYEELTKDYISVLSIDREKLPAADSFNNGNEFANALRHDQKSDAYNANFRQLIHCAYKIAAEKEDFSELLVKHRDKIEENVTYNLFERHLKPLFSE